MTDATRPLLQKVMAYITSGNRLLVFRQPDFPDAGIQVPGGTLDGDEPLDVAVLREAFEETGLPGLKIAAYLGVHDHDRLPFGQQDIHRRHYFHLTFDGAVPETWQHIERFPSEGKHDQILFEFFWAELPNDIPELIAERDAMLPQLSARMLLV